MSLTVKKKIDSRRHRATESRVMSPAVMHGQTEGLFSGRSGSGRLGGLNSSDSKSTYSTLAKEKTYIRTCERFLINKLMQAISHWLEWKMQASPPLSLSKSLLAKTSSWSVTFTKLRMNIRRFPSILRSNPVSKDQELLVNRSSFL